MDIAGPRATTRIRISTGQGCEDRYDNSTRSVHCYENGRKLNCPTQWDTGIVDYLSTVLPVSTLYALMQRICGDHCENPLQVIKQKNSGNLSEMKSVLS